VYEALPECRAEFSRFLRSAAGGCDKDRLLACGSQQKCGLAHGLRDARRWSIGYCIVAGPIRSHENTGWSAGVITRFNDGTETSEERTRYASLLKSYSPACLTSAEFAWREASRYADAGANFDLGPNPARVLGLSLGNGLPTLPRLGETEDDKDGRQCAQNPQSQPQRNVASRPVIGSDKKTRGLAKHNPTLARPILSKGIASTSPPQQNRAAL
jgi:hypothetical protein